MRKLLSSSHGGFLAVIVVIGCQSVAYAATDAGTYAVSSTWKIGGEGRWDYLTLDADHHLYVTRTSHTQIVDTTTGKLIADVKGGKGLHGTALVPSVGRAFVTDGKAAKLLVVDTKTHGLLGTIDAADDADGIIYDAGSNRVLVSCGDAGQLLVLDPKADVAAAKVEKVDLGGKPEFLAADGKGRAFVCMNNKNVIAVVDLKSLKVIDRWSCAPGGAPTGLAIDLKAGHLFVGCRNKKLIVMDTRHGEILADLPIGEGNDACGFDPGTGEAFASCMDGTLTVAKETSPKKFDVVQTVKTQQGCKTMTLDPATHAVYLPTAEFEAAEPGEKRPSPKPDSFIIVVVSPTAAH